MRPRPPGPRNPLERPGGQGASSFSGALPGALGAVALDLLRGAEPTVRLTPSAPGDQIVTWQGGSGVAIPNHLGAGFTCCPGATRTRASVWGALKSLYR